MNNQNWQLSEGDQFAPAAPDTLEHLPSHHCAPAVIVFDPAIDGDDIKGMLREHLTMSMFVNRETLYAEMNSQRTKAADRIESIEKEITRLEKSLKWEENYASRIGTHGPGCHMWGPSHYVCAMNKLAEVSKGHSMYEHVRTLNALDFLHLHTEAIAGKGKFDDLVLADMEKRMKDKSQ
jgi:hypothetical protein